MKISIDKVEIMCYDLNILSVVLIKLRNKLII
jgi:hypothetical protein